MIDRLRRLVLELLKVPAEPHPPAGDPAAVRIFRAAPNYFRYRLVLWGLKQLGALLGLVASLVAIYFATREVDNRLFDIALTSLEVVAWAGFLVQLPLSLAILRLDFELRWYIISDRALRIREGILSVREQTMTFANVQQVGIRQGPLQRLLGLADVHVTSAGGGASSAAEGGKVGAQSGMHEGFFRGVGNAAEIREAIRERTRLHRDAGLGDPDDPESMSAGDLTGAVEAARGLLSEVRALRATLPARL